MIDDDTRKRLDAMSLAEQANTVYGMVMRGENLPYRYRERAMTYFKGIGDPKKSEEIVETDRKFNEDAPVTFRDTE